MTSREQEIGLAGATNDDILDRTLVVPSELHGAIQLTTQEVERNTTLNNTPYDHLDETKQYDKGAIAHSLIDAFAHVNEQVIGREQLLTQTLYALLTREHQLIFSRAGIAKSLYANSIFSQFEGSQTFSIQMSKGTTEDALVGPVNINALKDGNIVHNTDGTIVDANFAFLDEIFDSNDVALRSLLGILNERVFKKGKQQEDAKLHTAIATTNFLRSSALTEAVIDRFAFRATLLPDYNPYNLLRIDEAYGKNAGRVSTPDRKIPFAHLEHAADVVEGKVPEDAINVPYHVLFMKNAVITEYQRIANEGRESDEKEVYISPRTIAKSREVLNASAFLRNSNMAIIGDLESLKYAITTIGDEKGENQFDQALKNVTAGVKSNDLGMVDSIMHAHTLLGRVLDYVRNGGQVSSSFVEEARMFFGLPLGELSFGNVKKPIRALRPNHPLVQELRQSFLQRVDEERNKAARG